MLWSIFVIYIITHHGLGGLSGLINGLIAAAIGAFSMLMSEPTAKSNVKRTRMFVLSIATLHYITLHHPAECRESLFIEAGPLSESMQQPEAAKVSTDLIFETWAPELSHDPDMEFILSGVQHGFHLLPPDSIVVHAFTQNNKSALRPGSKDQIEAQLVKGLQQDHFAVADHSHMPTIINALGAVPKKDSDKIRMIMDCSRPPTMNANSYIDLEHYKYVTVDDAANLCQPGYWSPLALPSTG